MVASPAVQQQEPKLTVLRFGLPAEARRPAMQWRQKRLAEIGWVNPLPENTTIIRYVVGERPPDAIRPIYLEIMERAPIALISNASVSRAPTSRQERNGAPTNWRYENESRNPRSSASGLWCFGRVRIAPLQRRLQDIRHGTVFRDPVNRQDISLQKKMHLGGGRRKALPFSSLSLTVGTKRASD